MPVRIPPHRIPISGRPRPLEKLTGAQPGTPEGDELAALLELIADYEDDHFPED